jgi:hypothetical protein
MVMSKNLTPIKAIRAKCLECAVRPKEVRIYQSQECPLFNYRLGRNPTRKGIAGSRKPGIGVKKNGDSERKERTQVEVLRKIGGFSYRF